MFCLKSNRYTSLKKKLSFFKKALLNRYEGKKKVLSNVSKVSFSNRMSGKDIDIALCLLTDLI